MKKILRFALGLPVGILAIIFIGKILFDSRSVLVNSFLHINLYIFFLGIIFYSLFFLVKSLVWLNILKKRGYEGDRQKRLWHYSISELKRYVPGNIFAFASRITSIEKEVPKKQTAIGIGIEALLLSLSAFVISLPAITYMILKTREFMDTPFLILVLGLIAIAGIAILIFFKFAKAISNYFDSFTSLIFAWFIYSLGSFFVAASFTYIYPSNILFILSFFVASWLIGYLSFITPMGLGVRELALTGSLSFFLPAAFASTIAVITRFGMILGELLFLGIIFVFSKIRKQIKILKLNPYFAVVIFFSILYFAYFSYFSIMRYVTFISGRFDLGNMSQTVWNTLHGNLFMLTNPDGTEQISRLAIHADFILIFFAPLYLIWSDPRMLLIAQAFILSFGGILTYLIAQRILKKPLISVILSLSFFLNFWIQNQNSFDFHAVSIGTTFLLASFYFLISKRYLFFGLFLLLAVLTKENVFIVASFFGIYLLVKEKKWIWGSILTIAPFIVFYYLVTKFIPNARGNNHFAISYYSYLGDSTLEILRSLILKPQIAMSQLINISTLDYFHKLLLPTGYLALLSPAFLLFAIPEIAIYLLSMNENLRSHQYHYGAIIIPFVYIASIYGIKLLLGKYNSKGFEKVIFYYLVVVTIISVYMYSPLPGMRMADYGPFVTYGYDKISSYIGIIPDSASVVASNSIGAHLSHRKNIYVIPHGINIADYIVIYNENVEMLNRVDLTRYQLLIQEREFYLFKRN